MILFFVLLFISLSICIDTVRCGISPMPTSKKAKKVILSLIGKGTVYELGSGWGKLAFDLSKKNDVKAFEMALVPWAFSCIFEFFSPRLSIQKKDFFSVDLSEADVVICYLCPKAMQKLTPKLNEELKEGSLIISNTFQLFGRKPQKVIEVNDWMRSQIYCYEKVISKEHPLRQRDDQPTVKKGSNCRPYKRSNNGD